MVTPGGATEKKMSSLSLPSLPFAFTITRDHLLFVANPVTRKMQSAGCIDQQSNNPVFLRYEFQTIILLTRRNLIHPVLLRVSKFSMEPREPMEIL